MIRTKFVRRLGECVNHMLGISMVVFVFTASIVFAVSRAFSTAALWLARERLRISLRTAPRPLATEVVEEAEKWEGKFCKFCGRLEAGIGTDD